MLQRRTTSVTPEGGMHDGAAAGEVALLRRIAAGDRAAFDALYRSYFPRLTRFLQRVLRRPQVVEEVLNDAMLVIWRKAASFNGQSKVSTWIFAIAYRRALKAAKRFDEPVEADDDLIESLAPGPERSSMHRELHEMLGKAMACMSADHRAVIELTYFHGYRYQEIAQIMDCPVDTVKTRMFHARRRLRRLLPERIDELP